MEGDFRYRGRLITAGEVEFIRQFIAQHPGTNRRQLSLRICEAWGWRQANGAPRDMVCRGLLLQLQRAGRLELPPARQVHRNPSARRATHGEKVLTPLLLDTTPLEAPLRALRPLEFQPVRRTPEEPLFNYLVAQYHPLGYARPVGEHLKYLVSAAGRVIACLAWSSAPRHLGARSLYRLVGGGAAPQPSLPRLQPALPHCALRSSQTLGLAHPGGDGAPDFERLGTDLRAPDLFSGNVRRSRAAPRHLLSGRQLGGDGADDGTGQKLPEQAAEPLDQGSAGLSAHAALS